MVCVCVRACVCVCVCVHTFVCASVCVLGMDSTQYYCEKTILHCTVLIFTVIECVIFYYLLCQDLIRDLKSELSGNFENVIIAMMDPKVLYDAKCLRGAMKVSTMPEGVM